MVKKFLPYILMFTIVANLFVPFSVALNSKNFPKIEKHVAQAAGIQLSTKTAANDTTITVDVVVVWENKSSLTAEAVNVTLKDALGKEIKSENITLADTVDSNDGGTQTGSVIFDNLTPETQYQISSFAVQNEYSIFDALKIGILRLPPAGVTPKFSFSGKPNIDPIIVTTLPAGQFINQNQGSSSALSADALLPACSMNPVSSGDGTFMGCLVHAFYYIIFVPTSYLFALAGKFFDWTFAYSITDTSYRVNFITEGWGLVRDICNIFFIFVLLYAAFGMILNINNINSKKILINVIIIGLLINFSLFATQVLVDTSNILARLFYSSKAIEIVVDKSNGNASKAGVNTVGAAGLNELALSAALVDKIDPQKIVLNAGQIKLADDISGNSAQAGTGLNTSIGVGSYFLVILMAVIVNIIGILVFLSVGLIFVSRVIGLWIAMILAPLAFFSYTVPSLAKAKMIGWSNWWSDTLGLCFVAPIFMFFLYLIVLFLDKAFNGLIQNSSGPNWALTVIIPFTFIMILLWTAKKLAKSYSGSIGQTITTAVTAIGGAALGGAALGAAFAGRQTIGAVSKYAQNDGARQNALRFKDAGDAWKKLQGLNAVNPLAWGNAISKSVAGLGKATAALGGQAISRVGRQTDPATGKETSAWQRQGAKLGDKIGAIQTLDAKAQAITGDKTATFKDLTDDEKQEVKNKIDRDIVSKEMHNKVYEKLTATERTTVDALRNTTDPRGEFAAAAETHKTTAFATRGAQISTATDLTKASQESTAVGEFVTALRKGSYDVRNISKSKFASGGLAGFGVGVMSTLAANLRAGLKQGVGVEYGTGQKDFLKDLKNVLSESLKKAKIQVVMPSGGKDSEEED